MKQFTVKDFLSYNNPCFSCKEHVNFYFVCAPKDPLSTHPGGYVTPIVSNTHISVDLKKTYSHSLTLTIYNKTNKFQVNNAHELKNFLQINRISLITTCPTCQTSISGKALQFDLNQGFIKPTELKAEILNIHEYGKNYHVSTSLVNEGRSRIIVTDNKGSTPWDLTIPPLPIYKFKNKTNLIKKIKTYMVFS